MTFNIQFVHQEIRRGIQAFKKGNKKIAWLHFQAALREDDENVTALLWLAFLADAYNKRRFLLERVLAIDPENQRAKDGLIWLQEKQPTGQNTSEATEATHSAEIENTDFEADAASSETLDTVSESLLKKRLHATLGTRDLKEKAKKGTIAQRARRRIGPLLLLLLCGGIFLGLAVDTNQLGIQVSQAASQLTGTHQIKQEPITFIAVTKSPEPRNTATPVPTRAPTDTPTPSPSPTPLPPTATPLPLAYQPQSENERWIEVDLSEQQLTAWEGTTPVMSFTASTGLPNTPTLIGQFRVYQKYAATRMIGPGYNLPDVPFTMYYDRGYAVHGAYWHNNFGEPMSHGCVNLSPEDAEQVFHWAGPIIPDGASQATASLANPGTLVVVHQ